MWWGLCQAERIETIAALLDDLIVIDPHVAAAGEHVDVRARLPIGVRLAAVGIAKSEMHAGEFFVLEQNNDHFRENENGAEGQVADAIAVFVGVTIIPELLL